MTEKAVRSCGAVGMDDMLTDATGCASKAAFGQNNHGDTRARHKVLRSSRERKEDPTQRRRWRGAPAALPRQRRRRQLRDPTPAAGSGRRDNDLLLPLATGCVKQRVLGRIPRATKDAAHDENGPAASEGCGAVIRCSTNGGGGTRTPKGLRPPHFECGALPVRLRLHTTSRDGRI
jgi:hypothetical protein